MRSMIAGRSFSRLDACDEPPGALECEGQGISQAGLGGDVTQIDAEVNDGLRDLGPDAADQSTRRPSDGRR